MDTYKLKTPHIFEGETYETLTLDFNRLTGRDIVNIDAEMAALGVYALSPEISRDFQARLVARAAGVVPEAITGMNAADFISLTGRARNFLLSLGL